MNKCIAIIIFCISSQIGFANCNVVDSLKQQLQTSDSDTQTLRILYSIGHAYEHEGNDSALIYFNQAKELSEKLGEKYYEALSVQSIGCYYIHSPSFDSAMIHHVKALELFTELDDSAHIAEQYANISLSFTNSSQFEKALKFNQEAIKVYEELGHTDKAVTLRSKLSELYMRLNDSDKALECLFDVIEYEPREEVDEYIASCYANIGFVYFQLNKILEAQEYFTKSLEYALQKDNKWDIAMGYALIGKAYIVLGEYKEAEKNILIGRKMFEELNDKMFLNKSNINLAELYLALKRYDEVIYYAEQSIEVSREIGVLWMENLAQYSLADAYYQLGNYKKAYDAHRAHKCVNDRVQAELKTKQIADVHVKYESEKLEQENVLLRLDNEQKRRALFKQRKFRNILLAFTIAILFMGLLLFNRYQMKKKINKELIEKNNLILEQQQELKDSNEELEQQKEEINTQAEILEEANATKDKFFSIIAHDLKTPFNSILGLCNIMLENYDQSNDAKRKKFVASIRDASATTFDLLTNLLVWARSQSNRIEINKEELNLASLVENSIQPYMKNAEEKKLVVYNQINNGKIVFADKYTISTVLGNLFSNAVKFTKDGGTITLDAQRNNGHIAIMIKDTGVGIPKDSFDKLFKITENYSTPGTKQESGTGLGLILCKEFIEKNGGEIMVDSKEGKGTTFTFTIPAK